MRFRRHHAFFGLAVVCLTCAIALLPGAVFASSTTHLAKIDFAGYGDQIYNYDFEYNSSGNSSTNVEWPIDLVFYDDSTIDSVKSALNGGWPVSVLSSPAQLLMNNRYENTGWVWDTDSGRKDTYPNCWATTKHYRVYAPSSLDAFFNPAYGFYVVGSTHEDHNEMWPGGCDAHYNKSEVVEKDIAKYLSTRAAAVYYDHMWFGNAQHDLQGNSHFDSDGYATYVDLAGGGGGCAKPRTISKAAGTMLVC